MIISLSKQNFWLYKVSTGMSTPIISILIKSTSKCQCDKMSMYQKLMSLFSAFICELKLIGFYCSVSKKLFEIKNDNSLFLSNCTCKKKTKTIISIFLYLIFSKSSLSYFSSYHLVLHTIFSIFFIH